MITCCANHDYDRADDHFVVDGEWRCRCSVRVCVCRNETSLYTYLLRPTNTTGASKGEAEEMEEVVCLDLRAGFHDGFWFPPFGGGGTDPGIEARRPHSNSIAEALEGYLTWCRIALIQAELLSQWDGCIGRIPPAVLFHLTVLWWFVQCGRRTRTRVAGYSTRPSTSPSTSSLTSPSADRQGR
jgi:hypothetical protein